MSDLRGESIRLSKLFSHEFFFDVPVYQRPFRWDDDNLSDLVTDLLDAPRNEDYFLGTLVLHETKPSHYDIVDGQQRLTALCILLACIRDTEVISGDPEWLRPLQDKIVQPRNIVDGIPEKPRLTVRDNDVFQAVVAQAGKTVDPKASGPSPSAAERRYLAACRIFHEELSSLSEGDLSAFAQFVSQKTVFMYLATSDFDNAFRLFTIVNDRGMQLRRIDVLKSHNLTPDVINGDTLRNRYAQRWEEMEEALGEDEFERVFHLMRLVYLKAKPQTDLLSEFLDRILDKKGKPKRGTSFVDELSKTVKTYNSIFLDRDFLSEGQDVIRFRSMIAIMNDHFNASEWKACCVSFAQKFGSDHFFDFLMQIEKKYLEHWVQGIRKDERYKAYVEILQLIDEAADANEVVSSISVDTTKIQEACESENFYGAGYSKYFLLRLEVVSSEGNVDKHYTARSVEHVLPQNPPTGGQWEKDFPTSAEVASYVHRAGNLVLLSKAKNSSANNNELEVKKEKYLRDRVSDYPRSMEVLAASSWNRDDIDRRTGIVKTLILRDPVRSED